MLRKVKRKGERMKQNGSVFRQAHSIILIYVCSPRTLIVANNATRMVIGLREWRLKVKDGKTWGNECMNGREWIGRGWERDALRWGLVLKGRMEMERERDVEWIREALERDAMRWGIGIERKNGNGMSDTCWMDERDGREIHNDHAGFVNWEWRWKEGMNVWVIDKRLDV